MCANPGCENDIVIPRYKFERLKAKHKQPVFCSQECNLRFRGRNIAELHTHRIVIEKLVFGGYSDKAIKKILDLKASAASITRFRRNELCIVKYNKPKERPKNTRKLERATVIRKLEKRLVINRDRDRQLEKEFPEM